MKWPAIAMRSDLGDISEGGFIVTVVFVADLFGIEPHRVAADVLHRRQIDQRCQERQTRAEKRKRETMDGESGDDRA